MGITAVVVARAGSKRLPNKALLPFAGSTLVGHKVRTLLSCPSIASVVVGSDSPDILFEGEKYGALSLLRDDYYCDESKCTANEMIADVISRVSGDLILWAHPTNPLISIDTYEEAIKRFDCEFHRWHEDSAMHRCDSLASVYGVKRHAWWHGGPFNHRPWSSKHQVAAELEPIQFQDGGIFIQPREQMLKNKSFYGFRPWLFEMPTNEVADIDTEHDYIVAKAIYEHFR